MSNIKLLIITFLLFLCILFFSNKTYLSTKEAIDNNYNAISKEIDIMDNKINNLNKDYKEILSQIPSLEESKDIEKIEKDLQKQIDELNSLIKELQEENEELKKELRWLKLIKKY